MSDRREHPLGWRDWLHDAAAVGWVRPLDIALAELFARQQPTTAPLVLISAALTSAALAQGHVCLPLATALADLPALLGPARQVTRDINETNDNGASDESAPHVLPRLPVDLTLSSWRDLLAASSVVWQPGREDNQAPLVLLDGRLYLRRYWRFQEEVASAIAARLRQAPALPATLPVHLDSYFQPLRDPAEQERRTVHWQSIAAALAARRRFAVISGGPGTGKTTTVVRLLGVLQQLALDEGKPLRIRLAAPTGKAAARLTESIGASVGKLPSAIAIHIPTEVTTIHRLLRPLPNSRQFRHGRDNPLHLDLLVIDEASMVDLELMAQLLSALPERARLILLGDKDQLASVEAGAVLGELCRDAGEYSTETAAWLSEATGYSIAGVASSRTTTGDPVTAAHAFTAAAAGGHAIADQVALLRKSHRFNADSGIGRLATAVNAGDQRSARAAWSAAPHELQRLQPTSATIAEFAALVLEGTAGAASLDLFSATLGYRHYLDVLRNTRPAAGNAEAVDRWAAAVLDAFGRFQLLAALRRGRWGVEGLNRAVEAVLATAELIDPGRPWYDGRPVMVTRNDYGLGLMNGDVGITLTPPGTATPRVFFSDSSADGSSVGDPSASGVRSVAASRLTAVETVFAMTVHKSQGSEFEHAVLVLPERPSPLLTRELVYTAITRARSRFTLIEPNPAVFDEAMQRRVVRASGLADRLAQLMGSMDEQ